MSDCRKILTIYIPTYNRADKLCKQLEAVLPQVTDEVQLVVRDNNSSFDFINLNPQIDFSTFQYIKNPNNIGADANIIRGFEFCSTKWLWILGDDDLVKRDAVYSILQIIKSKENAVYINLGSKVEKEVQGLENFADYFRIRGAFGNSFFTSHCLYNADKLIEELPFYYKNISSMIGQILIVIKFLEKHSDETSLFCEYEPIDDQCLDVSWNKFDYVIYSSIIFDVFKDKRKLFNRNIFASIATTYYEAVVKYSNEGFKNKIVMLYYILKKVGFINSLRYNLLTFLDLSLYAVLPHRNYSRIRTGLSFRYNSMLSENFLSK